MLNILTKVLNEDKSLMPQSWGIDENSCLKLVYSDREVQGSGDLYVTEQAG
jgi:hypothetical protein